MLFITLPKSFHSKILIFFFYKFSKTKGTFSKVSCEGSNVPKSTRKMTNSRGTRKHVFRKVIYGRNALIIGIILNKTFAPTNARLSFIGGGGRLSFYWLLACPKNLTCKLPSSLQSLSASWGRPAYRALGVHWLGDTQIRREKPASHIPMAQGPICRQL